MARKLRKVSLVDKVEDHLYEYYQLQDEMKLINEDILHGTPNTEDSEGIRGTGISDPTARKATALGQHRRLLHLEIWTRAIEQVYDQAPRSHQRLLELRYWKGRGQAKDWDYIAAILDVSERTVYRWRNEICQAVGHLVGER